MTSYLDVDAEPKEEITVTKDPDDQNTEPSNNERAFQKT
jgi:hypothetical protein